jgi:uncharacterized damage-inducible protein DinB
MRMNLADYMRRQFAYNTWANGEVLKTLRGNGGGSERSLQLMAHILAAERVWLDRLMRLPQSVAVWPEPDLARCETENSKLGRQWSEFLDDTKDLDQSIAYKNSKGESWTSTVIDVLTHVVMHSAYHRGQIASHMREIGQTPAYTDFIHGVRQGLVK